MILSKYSKNVSFTNLFTLEIRSIKLYLKTFLFTFIPFSFESNLVNTRINRVHDQDYDLFVIELLLVINRN